MLRSITPPTGHTTSGSRYTFDRKMVLHYKPHDSQYDVHKSNKRYRIVCAGRRYGKTLLAAAELIKYIIKNQKDRNTQIGVIAPTYQVAQRTLDAFIAITRDSAEYFQIKHSMPAIIRFNNNTIYFLSADRPDSIRGYGLSFLVIDEADYIDDNTFNKVIYPTTLDNLAPILAISTPSRKNSWFHKMYLDKNNPDIDSFHLKSGDNPYLNKDEIEKYRGRLPEDVFRQEFLAEWIDAGGSVFPSLDDINVHKVCSCGGGSTIMGIDLGQMHDFTVVTNLCPSCKVVRYIEKFNKIDYGAQKEIITRLYNDDIKAGKQPEIILDVTGVGRPIYDDLRTTCNVTPFSFSNSSKNQLISRLRVAVAEKEISISSNLKNYDILKSEMDGFIVTKTQGGLVSYSNGVDSGYDDTVISLALAVHGIGEYVFPTCIQDSDYGGLWEEEQEVDFGI